MDWFEAANEHLAKWKSRDAARQAAQQKELTPGAIRALAKARSEAVRLNRNYIGVEHILLGVIGVGSGVGLGLLVRIGLDPDAIRVEAEKQAGVGPASDERLGRPYTPRMQAVFAAARQIYRTLGHTRMGSGHLLVALLQQREGHVANALARMNLDRDQMRATLLKEMTPDYPPGDDEPVAIHET
jgi:ATP-dependent Clp protease ATP-binding subunit ClpC